MSEEHKKDVCRICGVPRTKVGHLVEGVCKPCLRAKG